MKKIGRDYTDRKTSEELIGHIGFGMPVVVDRSRRVKVLITGAGSYIGNSFIEYANKYYPDNFEIEATDMIGDAWKEADFSKYDIVYHVAGIAHADVGNVSDEVKEKYYKVNTDLAIEVAKKAKESGVHEFVFMSSMIVYGDSAPFGKEKIVDETTVPQPANFYGDSKLQADVAVRELADDRFKVVVLRPPMIYGKGSKGNYPILSKIAKKVPVFPNVKNCRSMLFVGNLCEFLCQIFLVSFKVNSCVLIPQNAEYTRTSEMVKEIAKVCEKKIICSCVFNIGVRFASVIPGKISGLVHKAFGNSCYSMNLSDYEGLSYTKYTLSESIFETEKES